MGTLLNQRMRECFAGHVFTVQNQLFSIKKIVFIFVPIIFNFPLINVFCFYKIH